MAKKIKVAANFNYDSFKIRTLKSTEKLKSNGRIALYKENLVNRVSTMLMWNGNN
jgi:hypothetical protein